MNRTLAARLLGIAAAASALAACAGDEPGSAAPPPTATAPALQGFAGPILVNPLPKPAFTLTTTAGQPYDFQKETNGKVALLYFGYTNCPDACPAAMANIALAVRRLPAASRAKIVTVFVTTDPQRDTPERLRTWLAQFDPAFVGLIGSAAAVARAQAESALPVATAEAIPGASPGTYGVDHAAVILAFSTDNLAHVEWPDGITVTGITQDLAKLAST